MDAPQSNSRLRVLVVDDEPDITLTFGKLLTRLGCEVLTCNAPDECVEQAREFNPQLAFLDVGMPRISGVQLAKQLRVADLPKCTLVASTGYGDARTHQECLDAGFDLVLVKPIRFAVLESVVEQMREPGQRK